MTVTDEGVHALVGAIGELAVKDYMRAYKRKGKDRRNVNADMTMNEVERFFKSRWFIRLYPTLDGAALFKTVKQNCMKKYGKVAKGD